MESLKLPEQESEPRDLNSVEANKIQKNMPPAKTAEKKEYSGDNFSQASGTLFINWQFRIYVLMTHLDLADLEGVVTFSAQQLDSALWQWLPTNSSGTRLLQDFS